MWTFSNSDSKDHPRRCGEDPARSKLGNPVNGSSPQMRGAPPGFYSSRPYPGIIPADAGSTLKDPCNPSNMIDEVTDF